MHGGLHRVCKKVFLHYTCSFACDAGRTQRPAASGRSWRRGRWSWRRRGSLPIQRTAKSPCCGSAHHPCRSAPVRKQIENVIGGVAASVGQKCSDQTHDAELVRDRQHCGCCARQFALRRQLSLSKPMELIAGGPLNPGCSACRLRLKQPVLRRRIRLQRRSVHGQHKPLLCRSVFFKCCTL
jgi:hypothetical protein